MKPFEHFYLCCEHFLPPLHRIVRRQLRSLAAEHSENVKVLDVGGRKSHYTIGVAGSITITDLPRETNLQEALNLGVTDQIVQQLLSRRSNVNNVVYDDMVRSHLRSDEFDLAVAVEVLEHVDEDELFVRNVHRILKPGGVFIMTTPNGDSVPNHNPDHKRHYKRQHLRNLLEQSFSEVRVVYAVRGGVWRRLGLKSWSLRRPFQTGLSMVGNVINSWQSSHPDIDQMVDSTRHLFAVARKST